jgi:hypothetical protein
VAVIRGPLYGILLGFGGRPLWFVAVGIVLYGNTGIRNSESVVTILCSRCSFIVCSEILIRKHIVK